MPDTSMPELRLSPDNEKIAARWPTAPKPTWYIIDIFDIHEAAAVPPTGHDVETWQRLAVDPNGETKDYLRRQWATASAKLNAAESKLAHEQQLHGFAKDRVQGLEADIQTRWHTANIGETVKTELRRVTAERDTYRAALQDVLAVSQQYQLIGVTRLGLKLGFYPDALDSALENQAEELQRLRAEVEQLRSDPGDPE